MIKSRQHFVIVGINIIEHEGFILFMMKCIVQDIDSLVI